MILKEIEERRALRALSEKKIPEELLLRVLEAATLAPSCANSQPWRFLVLNNPETLKIVKEHLAGGNYWGKKSPAVIAVITREDLDAQLPGNRNYAFFDTGMACMNLQLQAHKEGLISHPIAGFRAIELREALAISDDYTLLTLIILAYPGGEEELSEKHLIQEKSPRLRKPFSEVVFFNNWEN
ncbi:MULTISPECIES: nitroreductase family protein [unclassified Oceanispirochaeta]|uniref:nitroreductase family protein n=1 Tax=unclassified Oceanispirochaeta TaxID=2635722 RepID=UPI001C13058A|nr:MULTISPECIES: nitroreductase family protein [unclassified Oceanispirochaeta]